jgi:phospholipase D1/2
MPAFDRRTTEQLGLPRASQLPTLPAADDTDIGGPPIYFNVTGQGSTNPQDQNPLTTDIKLANIDKDCMRDPLNPSFYDEVWCRAAENNTKLFRRVFRCMPDSEVTNWAEYKEYNAYNKRFKESMDGRSSDEPDHNKPDVPAKQASTGGGIGAPGPATVAKAMTEKVTGGVIKAGGGEGPTFAGHHMPHMHDEKKALSEANLPGSKPAGGDEAVADPEKRAASGEGDHPFPSMEETRSNSPNNNRLDVNTRKERRTTFSDPEKPPMTATSGYSSTSTPNNYNNNNTNNNERQQAAPQKRRRRATTRGSRRGFSATDEVLSRQEAEELLGLTQGVLVQFPYDWLLVEETNGNWLFQVDQVAPLQI